MKALRLAHPPPACLHLLDWAHDDINSGNILVDEAGMPVLI